MALPTLPQQSAPQIPTSQVSTRKPGGGSDLLFIIALTFLFLWISNRFSRPTDTESPVSPQESQQSVEQSQLSIPSSGSELPKEVVQAAKRTVEPKFVTLGSLDPKSEYRMLVTLSNRGAAVARLELNEKNYRDTHDRTGYFGQIIVDESIATAETDKKWPGVAVQIVGLGTPIEKSGIKQGDRIVSLTTGDQTPVAVDSFNTLRSALLETRPGQKIALEILPQKDIALLKEKTPAAFSSVKAKRIEVELQAAPVSILRPEGLVRSYSDYQNLRGLQGTVSMDRSSKTIMKAPEKKKPLAASDKAVSTASNDKSAVAKNEATPSTAADKKVADKTGDKSSVKSDEKSGEVASKDAVVAEAKLIGGSSSVPFVNAEEVIDLERHLADPARKLNSDPLSFMLTLGEYDEVGKLKWYPDVSKASHTSQVRSSVVGVELPETDLRNGYWEYVQAESKDDTAVFRKILLPYNLEVRKIYSLVKGAAPNAKGRKERNAREYHLTLRVEVVNLDTVKSHKVSYLLDGPTGLPIEGAWYSSGRKTGPGWGLYGLRDLVLQMKGKPVQVVKCSDVANDTKTASDKVILDYIGVDTQYFQCTMIPSRQGTDGDWHEGYSPLRVGSRDKDLPDVTNVSFRLKSNPVELGPAGQKGDRLTHEYQIFAGPKQQQLLDNYELGDTLIYGWFWFAAKPLAAILHFFHDYMVFNYGLAIIMLTILVRLILFPMSMKQVTSSIKMQELQPQLAQLKERYKDNPQEMMKAQQALFREHGVNPMSGCLPLFIQLPIFIGLYKALSLDVNLYGAPLFYESFRWCSNLAAPDMLADWSSFWNSVNCYGFNMGHGMLYLGPFFNLLPMLTIVLFLVQQKFMMPPVVGDDDTARQQRMMRRMMNFMMLFMGLMFFKIPSGLCVYFVCSSLWGILERQFHPKQPQPGQTPVPAKPQAAQGSWFAAGTEKKQETSSQPAKKSKRGRRSRGESAPQEEKSSWRKWWDDLLEKAKEQQRIAKSETEKRNRNRKKK